LREANSKLTQLSVQKDAFLSQISHELRTPMTSIRSFSEILRDTKRLSGEEKTKYASIIHVEAIRLTRLLDDLLDLSVLENGQVSLNEATGGMGDVIDHAVETTQAGGGALSIVRVQAATPVMVHTDLDRLAQVFINLVSNAQKYCKAEVPELTIELRAERSHVEVHFTDNGVPIPPNTRALIFEKFARIDDQDGSGAGLGLAICREIMARLGGDIFYVPMADGNRFVVRLPQTLALAAQ
jgi:signal transduction histidine kinase